MNWRLLIFILLLAGQGWGGQYIISSLPDTIFQTDHSGDTWDTIFIVDTDPGTSSELTVADQTAIIFGENTHHWLMKLDSDTIIFGTDSSAFPYIYPLTISGDYEKRRPMGIQFGERFSGYCYDIIIRGGYFLNRPGGVENDTLKEFEYSLGPHAYAKATYCFYLKRAYDITFKGVYAEIVGYQGHVTHQGKRNIWIDSCHFVDNTHAFERRDHYMSCVCMISKTDTTNFTDHENDYHLKITNSVIDGNCHNGIYVASYEGDTPDSDGSIIHFENDTFNIDIRNYLYPKGTPYQLFHSCANGYAITLRGPHPRSSITNCTFLSGENYNGGRGLFLQWCGWYINDGSDYFDISNNYFNIHEGTNTEYPIVYFPCAIKGRRRCKYIDLKDNVIIYRADVKDTVLEGYWNKGACITWQFEMDTDDPTDPPYHINIENNICSALVITTDHQHYDVFAASVAGCNLNTEVDTSFHFRYNYLYSQGRFIFNFGSYDAPAHYVVIADDTVYLDNSKNPGDQWVWNAGSWGGHIGVAGRDAIYLGQASDTLVTHQYPYGDHGYFSLTSPQSGKDCRFTVQRTLELYVKGNNGLPVVGATVMATNNYTQEVVNGNTNNGGLVSGVVSYGYYARVGSDSINFNNFTLVAIKVNDTTTNSSYEVNWTATGGMDTLTLTSTAGTGEWDSDETSPQIADIGPSSAWKDSTDDIVFTATDAHALDSISCYIRGPNSDSNSVHDTTFSEVVISYSPTPPAYEYTWLDSGNVWIVVVAVDTCATTGDTRDSLQLLIDVYHPPVSFKGISYKGMTIKHK